MPLECPSRPGLPSTSRSLPAPISAAVACAAWRTAARSASGPGRRRRHAAQSGGRPVFAEHLPQRRGPLAGGHARPGAGQRGLHQVDVRARRLGPQPAEGGPHLRLVAPLAPLRQVGQHRLLVGRVHVVDRGVGVPGERAGLGGLEAVDPHDLFLARLDARAPGRVRGDELGLEVTGLHRRHHPAQLRHRGDLRLGAGHQLRGLGRHHGGAVEQVAVLQQVRLVREHLLDAQAPLLVPGRGRPSASFQAGSCTARARASLDKVTASISRTIRWTLFSGCASVRPSELTCTP